MKIGVLLFQQFHGREGIGSSRIRGRWLCKYWPEAEPYKFGQHYDVIIYQKAYWLERIDTRSEIRILDMCDPDFMHWGYRIKTMIDSCHAITTSTEALASYWRKLTDKPVMTIPDRLDLEELPSKPKEHKGPTKTAVWFGYSENFPMLDSAVNSLVKVGIEELIVIASKRAPFMLPSALKDKIRLVNFPWSPETVHRDIMQADVVINPMSTSARWKFKSNNKTILAQALGMPVAHNKTELEKLMTEEQRRADVEKNFERVRKEYDVKLSVEDYKKLIEQIQNEKTNQKKAA